MKRNLKILAAFTLALSLCACGGMSSEQKNTYKQAYLNTGSLTNFAFETLLCVTLHQDKDTQMRIEQSTVVNEAFTDDMKYKIKTDSSLIGPVDDIASAPSDAVEGTSNTYYYSDEVYYMALAEGNYAVSATKEEAAKDVETARRLFSVDIEDFLDYTFTQSDDGRLTVSFTAPYSEVKDYMETVLKSMSQSLKLDGALESGNINGTVTVDAEGYIERQTISFASTGSVGGKAVTVDTKMDINLAGYGEAADIVMPNAKQFKRIA